MAVRKFNSAQKRLNKNIYRVEAAELARVTAQPGDVIYIELAGDMGESVEFVLKSVQAPQGSAYAHLTPVAGTEKHGEPCPLTPDSSEEQLAREAGLAAVRTGEHPSA